jgi:hypothetical protein
MNSKYVIFKKVKTYVISLPSGLNHLIFLFDPESELELDLHSSWISPPSLPVRASLFTESDVSDSEVARFFRTRIFFKV